MLRMVEAASLAGATHVKLQHIFSENLSFRPQFEEGLIVDGKTLCIKRPFKDEYDRLKKLELNEKSVKKFIAACNSFNVIPATTCFSRQHVDLLYDLGFRSVKVASYDCSSFQLLRDLVNYDWEIIVSTGATYDKEIETAVEILKESTNFSLLHCITIYPTLLHDLNLNRINFLNKYCKEVGFSDHTLTARDGVKASIAAIYVGAQVIERHFTILADDKTKDGPVSVNPKQFEEIVKFSQLNDKERRSYIKQFVPEFDVCLGVETRNLTEQEILNRDYYKGRFASINPENPQPNTMIFNWEEVTF